VGKAGTLLNVYTFPEYRRKGIAKRLLEEIIKEAKLIGIDSIDLKATEDGYNLYKKLGFKDDDNYKGMILKM
jgi:ribosomal protein S18 acetylase RimI-like enzyme